MENEILGRLDINAFKHDAIENGVGAGICIIGLIIICLLFYFKRWKWLWNEWITSLDPKRIGIMYLVVVLLMLFKGVTDAAMMRAQLAFSVGDSHGFLGATHFQQVFTAHGTTMIFFVGMGVLFAMMNLIIPLQIGARDVAFPFLNSVSFWLFTVTAFLVNLSMMIGEFSATGWLAYPPLSEMEYNPGVGVDYWIWVLQIAGVGTLLGGINFLVTIFKMRCPGMTFMKLPLFTWCCITSLILILFAFPILTATLAMLALDRLMGMHFFTSSGGGNAMMYVNLIWAWGHPEVYILVLPPLGIFSEVVSTFSQKRLFGYVTMIWAIIAITFLSFVVWLHHFFTMGAGPNVNAFFGIMTMLIAVPTGVKIFNWLFTMYGGRVKFSSAMLWFLAFIFVFTTGGMTGVLLSVPAADFQLHNSLFLIAHFHSMVIGGVLFGFFAGLSYWFPKFTGFKLNERIGRYAFWCWFFGFLIAFMPLYVLGFMGATRRLDHYEASTGWYPHYVMAAFGIILIIAGIIFQNLQILVSYLERKDNMDTTGDPWNGRTLEWATTSPPPPYNFARIPNVHELDALWAMKKHKALDPKKLKYEDIHMPRNSALGLYIGILSFLFGFGIIWHMFWLAIIGLIGIITCVVIRTYDKHTEEYITAAEVEKIENQNLKRKRYW